MQRKHVEIKAYVQAYIHNRNDGDDGGGGNDQCGGGAVEKMMKMVHLEGTRQDEQAKKTREAMKKDGENGMYIQKEPGKTNTGQENKGRGEKDGENGIGYIEETRQDNKGRDEKDGMAGIYRRNQTQRAAMQENKAKKK